MNINFIKEYIRKNKINKIANLLDYACGSSCLDYFNDDFFCKIVNNFYFFDKIFGDETTDDFNSITIKEIENHIKNELSKIYKTKLKFKNKKYLLKLNKLYNDKVFLLEKLDGTAPEIFGYNENIPIRIYDFITVSNFLHFYNFEDQTNWLRINAAPFLSKNGLLYIESNHKKGGCNIPGYNLISESDYKEIFLIDKLFEEVSEPPNFNSNNIAINIILRKK